MSFIRTITLTKTSSTPEDAFSNYPHPSTEQFAEFSSKYNVTRTIEETADSLIIKLIFSTDELGYAAISDPVQLSMRQERNKWMAENHITGSVDHVNTDNVD